MSPSPPRLVAIWVPDWPVVALTLESRAQRRATVSSSAGGTAGSSAGASATRASAAAPTTDRATDRAAGRAADRVADSAQSLPDPALEAVAVVGAHEILAASAPARAAGLRTGMPLRTARSLCPSLIALPHQPLREARSFEVVMDALDTHLADPLIARPGLAVCSARGPARWAGGEEELAARLIEAVAQGADVECQVGIADSLAGAVLAARQNAIIQAGTTPGFLSTWPLSAALACLPTRRLRHETADLLETLGRLGLRTLGDLAALPLKDVTARFGAPGTRLHLLASGCDHHVPRTTRPTKDMTVRASLDPPIERADAAAFAARSLAEDLCARLLAAGAAAGRLNVEAHCQDGSELTRSWMLETTPTATELTDRVRWQLDGWLSGRSGRPPASALTLLSLSAVELSPAGSLQAGLWQAPGQQAAARAARAAHRIESILGAGGVHTPILLPGRDPRSRAALTPWGESQATRSHKGADTAPWNDALPAPSPSIVLARPRPVLLLDAHGRELGVDIHGQLDGEPASLRAQEDRAEDPHKPADLDAELDWGAQDLPVTSWAGPWPMDEGWWTPTGACRRAYLQITTTQGPPLLLMRSGRWWVEALYH